MAKCSSWRATPPTPCPSSPAEIARHCGRPVGYANLPEPEYEAALRGAGLPEALAHRALRRLIGRPTAPMSASVARALGRP